MKGQKRVQSVKIFKTMASKRTKREVDLLTECSIVGYVFGGIAESIGWRACFFIEAAAGIPIVLIAVLVPNVRLNQKSETSETGEAGTTKLHTKGMQGIQ